jgi:hypothetical protein
MLQLALAIWGIIVLFTGKLKVTSRKQVEGTAARLLGLVMLAPLPVGFAIGLGVGMWASVNGKSLDDIRMPMLAVDVVLVLGVAALVVAVAQAIGKPPPDENRPPPPWTLPPPPMPPPGPPADPNNPYHPPQV